MMIFNIFYILACDGQILDWFLVLEIEFDIMYSDRRETAEGSSRGPGLIVMEMSCLCVSIGIITIRFIFSTLLCL